MSGIEKSDYSAKIENMKQTIQSLDPWYHNIHLPGGIQTAPDHFLGDFPMCKWNSIMPFIPDCLDGETVLDIGCNAGFYAIEFAKRGAHVVAVDASAHYLRQARWIIELLGLTDKITLKQMQLYHLALLQERYDIVLFLGVMYHLRYPLLGLDIVSQKVKKLMILQCLSMPGDEIYPPVLDSALDERDYMRDPGWPKMAFIEHQIAGDPTNWWAPNRACIEAMVRSSGLRVMISPAEEMYICEPDPESKSSIATWNKEEYEAIISMMPKTDRR